MGIGVLSAGAQIHQLGKDNNDRFLPKFWNQQANSSNLIAGLNAYAPAYGIRFVDSLLPLTINGRNLSGTFSLTNSPTFRTWDSTAGAWQNFNWLLDDQVPASSNTVSRVGFPETLLYKTLNNFLAQNAGSNLDGILRANGASYADAISGLGGTNTIWIAGTNYFTFVDGVLTGSSGSTNFTGTGITSLAGLTGSVLTFSTNASGNDFAITASGTDIAFSLPSASATKRGAVTAVDWSLFNSKQAGNDQLTALAAMSGVGVVVRSGANTFVQRAVVGTNGITVSNGTGITGDIIVDGMGTNSPAAILTTKGDLLTHDGTGLLRHGVGANGEVIIADSGETDGWRWGTVAGGITGLANPSASVGLTAVNGSATTAMRSDAAPALDQSIAPTWTGTHTWYQTSPSVAVDVQYDPFGTMPTGNTSHKASPVIQLGAFIWDGASPLGVTGVLGVDGTSGVDDQSFIMMRMGTGGRVLAFRSGDVVVGKGNSLATTNTAGFLWIPETTGTPAGTPSGTGVDYQGTIPITYDSTNNKLYAYDSGWVDLTGSGASGANPSATIGLTAVNGSAGTFLRSDGAPALSQSIAPTWTGTHKFTGEAAFGPDGANYATSATTGFPQMGMVNGFMTSSPTPLTSKAPFAYDYLHQVIQWYDSVASAWRNNRETYPHTDTDDGTQSFVFGFGAGTLDVSQATTFTTSERASGRHYYARLTASGGPHNLTWPGTWKWVGSTAPASIASGKVGLLELWCYGTNDSDVVARWTVEP